MFVRGWCGCDPSGTYVAKIEFVIALLTKCGSPPNDTPALVGPAATFSHYGAVWTNSGRDAEPALEHSNRLESFLCHSTLISRYDRIAWHEYWQDQRPEVLNIFSESIGNVVSPPSVAIGWSPTSEPHSTTCLKRACMSGC